MLPYLGQDQISVEVAEHHLCKIWFAKVTPALCYVTSSLDRLISYIRCQILCPLAGL